VQCFEKKLLLLEMNALLKPIYLRNNLQNYNHKKIQPLNLISTQTAI